MEITDIIVLLVYLVVAIGLVASMWKTFVKAGEAGWACLVPIYSLVVLLRMAGKPWWWLFLILIPLVNFIIAIMVTHELSKRFGGGVGMTLMLIFLPFIAWPMLGFGSAVYSKDAGSSKE